MTRRWVLPLLLGVWALGLHSAFLHGVPDPIFQPDSASYASFAIGSFVGNPQAIPIERSPAYPLFLYVVLHATAHFFGVLIVQHALALLTGVGAAWAYYRFIRPSLAGSAVVFFGSAALPVTMIYAHSILTETFYTFFLVAAVILFLWSQESPRALVGYAAGIASAIAILTRPTGNALLAAFLLAGLVSCLKKPATAGPRRAAVTALALWFVICGANFVRHGFFGTDQMAGPALYCANARYLDPATLQDPTLRNALTPIYAHHPDQLANGEWVYSAPDGPVRTLMALYPPERVNKVLVRLGLQAIRSHPFLFALDRLRLFKDFFWHYSEIPDVYLNREFTFFVYRGLKIFNSIANGNPQAWRLLVRQPEDVQAYYDRIRPLAMGRVEHPEDYLRDIDRQDVYRYGEVLAGWWPISFLFGAMRWLPLLAFLSILPLATQAERRGPLFFLLLVIALQAFVSTMAAFQDPRFAAPITPLYLLLAVGGIQSAFDRLRRKPTP